MSCRHAKMLSDKRGKDSVQPYDTLNNSSSSDDSNNIYKFKKDLKNDWHCLGDDGNVEKETECQIAVDDIQNNESYKRYGEKDRMLKWETDDASDDLLGVTSNSIEKLSNEKSTCLNNGKFELHHRNSWKKSGTLIGGGFKKYKIDSVASRFHFKSLTKCNNKCNKCNKCKANAELQRSELTRGDKNNRDENITTTKMTDNEKRSNDEDIKEKRETSEYSDEDHIWQEEQLKRKERIKKKIDDYIHRFTVHGLTKVFEGNRVESLFWLGMLLGGILLSVMVVSGLVSKYLSRRVYTEIKSQITDKNYFPSITLCEDQLLMDSYFSYCGKPPKPIKNYNRNKSCDTVPPMAPEMIDSIEHKYWSNGIFNVTKCLTWGGKRCCNANYLKSLRRFNHSCITWNYGGKFHDIYSHTDIEFSFTKPTHLHKDPRIIAIPHDPYLYELDITGRVNMEPYRYYVIKLDKTIIKRLPSPFPANCTKDKTGDIFPGKYSRRSCIESAQYIQMYKQCGATLDYVKPFIPKEIKRKYTRNRTIRETEECFTKYIQMEAQRSPDCRFPCEDLDLGTVSNYHERDVEKDQNTTNPIYRLSIQFQRVDTYKIIEEKELYSWDQMACEIGGFIGLVIGSSVISLVEIGACIVLWLAK